MTREQNIEWSRRHFAMMKDGGTWAVPRSGMIFQKKGNALILISEMPHMPEMPITAEQLREQQDGDFRVIKEYFEAAGVAIRK
jgi:hypothetical protein